MMIFLLKFVFILIEQSVQIISADCFFYGLTASQSPLFAKQSIVGYTLLISLLFRFAFASKVFPRYALKSILKKYFQLVSNFIFLPPSFCFLLRSCSNESTKDRLSLYLIWTFASRFAGVFRKSFYSLTIIGKLQAVCWGVLRKFYKKIAKKFSRQSACKKEVRLYQTSSSTIIVFCCFSPFLYK